MASRVEPARTFVTPRAFLEQLRRERAYPKRFLVRAAKGYHFVKADDVDWIDAQGNYARLHAGGRAHMLRATMKGLEGQLDPDRFVRVHRSAIVNIDRVARLEPHEHGEYVIEMRDGVRLTSSRAHSARFRELLRER